MKNTKALTQKEIDAREVPSKVVMNIRKDEYIYLVQNNPSVRGMILGYIYEKNFMDIMSSLKGVSDVYKPDDHDRKNNKSDLIVKYRDREIRFQLKSIQTGSIREVNGGFECVVQNDASDKRSIRLPNDKEVNTTSYKFGDYDVLAVCLIPFTKKCDFCFKLNSECKRTANKNIDEDCRQYLMKASEKLTYPLDDTWTTDVFKIMDSAIDGSKNTKTRETTCKQLTFDI